VNPKVLSRLALLCLLALAAACGSSAYHRGMFYAEKHQWDLAADNLQTAVDENPHDLRYQEEMVRAKLKAAQTHMDLAQMAIGRLDYSAALKHLERALHYDPSNQYAKDQLQKVVTLATAKEANERQRATTIDEMKADAHDDTGVPRLDAASNIPIVLKFTDTSAKTILDAISKASGVNFLYDDKADVTKRLTVDFAKVNLSQVLDYLMMQTKSFYKVLDPHTLIIVPDNKQKRDEYTDQVIRTFYLSNADAKDVFQLVRSILQARKMAMNQDLNSITIQDSPEIVAICQQIIEENDKSKGEVTVDVELLEVDSTLERDLGINLSGNGQFTIGPQQNLTYDSSGNPSGIGTGPPVPLNKLINTITHGLYIFPVPNFVVDFLLNASNGQVLARPQLRVMEGQKAMVHIGKKYPIPTANLYGNTAGTVGGGYSQPVTSYTYQDIGVKIEIEPKVHHNHEITIKLKVEISAIAGNIKGTGSTPDQPIIGTRESNSVIRLQDGETSMMAGLISQEERHSLVGLPGISEIPILRRLFSNNSDTKDKTDVVMLLTPHIVRMPNITEADIKPVWVGTADNPKLRGQNLSWAPSPFGSGTADKTKAAPAATQPPAQPAGQPAAQPAGQLAPVKTPPPAVPPPAKPAPVSTVAPSPAAPAPAPSPASTVAPAPAAPAPGNKPPAGPAPIAAGPAGTIVTPEPGLTVAIVPAQPQKGSEAESPPPTAPAAALPAPPPPTPPTGTAPPAGGSAPKEPVAASPPPNTPSVAVAPAPVPPPEPAVTAPPATPPAVQPAAPAPVAAAPAPAATIPAPQPPAGEGAAANVIAARLLLSPSTQTVDQGQQGILNLVLVGAQDYKGFKAQVDYPPDILKFQGAEEGTFFKMGGGKTTFASKETSPGHLTIEMSRADGASSGSGLVLRVKFTAAKPGEANIGFANVSATHTSGQSVQLSNATGVFQVPAPQPEPQPAPAAGAPPAPPAQPAQPPTTGGKGSG
jgi:general secretion pathway protein D